MFCWNCGTSLESPSWGKLSFRAVCDKCLAALHCCHNCKNHKLGLSNECLVPNTEFVSDRRGTNFCEDFVLLGIGPAIKDESAQERFERLFKIKGSSND
jgi:hypothetical protein